MTGEASEPKRDRRKVCFRFEVHPTDPQQHGYTQRYCTVRYACCDVLERMPEEAREAVLANATVIWPGPGRRIVGPLSYLGDKPLVVLLASDIDSYPPDVTMTVIAHEFAHVCLDHRWRADASDAERAAAEAAANDLARAWGSKR